jgi:hypothetical protein
MVVIYKTLPSLPMTENFITLSFLVPPMGFEPITYWLKASCSTNWSYEGGMYVFPFIFIMRERKNIRNDKPSKCVRWDSNPHSSEPQSDVLPVKLPTPYLFNLSLCSLELNTWFTWTLASYKGFEPIFPVSRRGNHYTNKKTTFWITVITQNVDWIKN